MDFYVRLKELARVRGISIKEMLDQAAINRDTYDTWKKTSRLPRVDQAAALAKVLNVRIEDLLIDEPAPIATEHQFQKASAGDLEERQALMDIISKLNPKDFGFVRSIVLLIVKYFGMRT